VVTWSFLTNHARVLLCIARDPGTRLRDIAASLGITERAAHGIVNDLADAGYVVKQEDGRRNRYQIQAHLPLPEAGHGDLAVGEVLALLAGPQAGFYPRAGRIAPTPAGSAGHSRVFPGSADRQQLWPAPAGPPPSGPGGS
jgi:hypothetical protein